MRFAKTLSIRVNEDELQRLEQAAALSGCPNLSAYIREKLFSGIRSKNGMDDDLSNWAEKEKTNCQLNEISSGLVELRAMMSSLLFLAHKKATPQEINGLRAAIKTGSRKLDMFDKMAPELAELIKQFDAE